MAVRGGEDAQPLQQGGQPEPGVRRLLPQAGHRVVAGDQQGLQVGLAAAGGEHAVGSSPQLQPLGGPVDEPALDHGGAGALVPGVHRGVHGGEDGLAHQRGDHHRAVQVGRVLGVVEVDGIAEVDGLEFLQGGSRIRQRPVEVHRADACLHFSRPDAGERLGGPSSLVATTLTPCSTCAT